jgi:hypothetical protein
MAEDFFGMLSGLSSKPRQPLPEDPTVEIETAGKDPAATLHAPAGGGDVTAKNFLRHPDVHPIALDLLLIRKYGSDWLEWEPESFALILPRDFQAQVSDLTISKIQALKTLHLVDDYWNRWEVFIWLTMSLNSIFPDFEVLQVPTVAQCMVSVDIANRVRTDTAWSQEMKLFLAVVHTHDDILVPQPPLDFVKIDTTGLPLNAEEIARAWAQVRVSGQAPQGDTVADEQLRRMLLVYKYLEESRVRLEKQLPILGHV